MAYMCLSRPSFSDGIEAFAIELGQTSPVFSYDGKQSTNILFQKIISDQGYLSMIVKHTKVSFIDKLCMQYISLDV